MLQRAQEDRGIKRAESFRKDANVDGEPSGASLLLVVARRESEERRKFS